VGAGKIKGNEESEMTLEKLDIKGLSKEELETWVQKKGFEPYRGRQIWHWILKKTIPSFEHMNNVPKRLRHILEEETELNPLKLVRKLESKEDGTRKYLFKLKDGYFIESVLIPEMEKGYFTLCISSQAGCAMACKFCLTAKQGLKRNLTTSEIVDQVVQVKSSLTDPARLRNIVFMGMGEPLANYESVIKAINIFTDPHGMNFSYRRITVSTCGLIPQIERFGKDAIVNLAVSLNASDNETRNFIMPVNKKYPLKELISVCRRLPLPKRRRITFEYVLIGNVNDREEDAVRLVELIKGMKVKINLIPLNPHPGIYLSPPSVSQVIRFQEILLKNNLTAIIRKSRGRDIMAACGQLSGSYELCGN